MTNDVVHYEFWCGLSSRVSLNRLHKYDQKYIMDISKLIISVGPTLCLVSTRYPDDVIR